MTGAGFGGCSVALVNRSAVDQLRASIRETFSSPGWREPCFYLTAAVRGVTVE